MALEQQSGERDAVIRELLAQESLSEEQLVSAETLLAESRAAGQQALSGTEWILNQKTYKLTGLSYPGGETRCEIDLPRPEGFVPFNPDNWDLSGSHVTLFSTETSKKSDAIAWKPEAELRLLQSAKGLALSGSFLADHNLAALNPGFMLSAQPKQMPPNGPLDLFFAPSFQWLAIADRCAGEVHLLDLTAQKLHSSFRVRAAGSAKGLNLAFREQAEQLVIIDNTSSVGIWSFAGEQVNKLSPGAGLLGNGLVSPDETQLWAMATKPNPGLRVIDLNSGEVIKEISIKGSLYSVGSDAPSDLLSLTPDGKNLLFMTYLNEPEPFTPVISVVDLEKQKTTQRFAIKDGSRPCLLSFMEINPLAAQKQSLVDLLLSMELISAEDLHRARLSAREKEQQAAAAALPQAQALDLDQRAFEEAQKEQEEADEPEEATAEGGFKPEKAPQMNISPVADELIIDLCALSILKRSQGELDIKNNADLAEALGRVKAAATRARHELEWHTGAIIKLKKLIGEMNFEQVITREEMEQMLHKHERDSLVQSQRATVPSNCPNCAKPMLGSYVCSYCGYEVERPEELLKRGLISIASVKPLDNLAEGHFLVIDIEGKRILEIDTQRNISWTMGKDILSEGSIELEFPRDAVRLATRNTLVTDYSLNRVVEITPSGRLFWEYNNALSPEHQLKNPVRATANGLNHVLIVDQGRHRVIEVDKQSKILNQIGHTDAYGVDNLMLNMPSDAQRLVNGNFLITDTGNHRVLEIEDQRVIWQYGNPENLASGGYGGEPGFLSYPQSALRMDNGHTLIVDAGNLRLIEVNAEGEIVFAHKTNEGPEEQQMDSPFRSAYMPNGLIMLLSESSVIEIDPKAKEVVWACQLSEFERAKVTLKPQQTTKRFVKHGVNNPYLRFKQEEVDSSEEAQNRIQELVAKRMAASRTANSNKAHISRFGEAELLPLDFFLVERNKNRVVRTDRDGNLSWRYGEKEGQELQKPHACTRTPEGHLLLSDTDRHRIIEIDPASSTIVWQFGETDSPRTGDKGLNRPRFAQVMPNGNFLIIDQNNRRVFEMRRNKQIAWVYEGLDKLMAPYHAERVENGNTLITDWGAHCVVEVNPEGEVVWSFGERKVAGADASHLSYPEHAARMPNGNTLISDTRNDRVLEVSPDGQLVWELDGKDAIKFGSPTYARRMKNGHTLVIHSSNRQMLEVDAKRKLVWKLMLPFDRPASPTARPATTADA
ncbi:MAG: hypothetical protein IGS03_12860 [Candidatus Sericytochromatia bacterium]|nr:hypothetical protein [Candidatus Sericytochromatia bacterium]